MKLTTNYFNKTASIAIAILMITVGVQYGLNPAQGHHKSNVLANWVNAPQTLEEAEKLASSVVVGRVISIRKGKDIVAKQEMEPSGEMRIPTEVVTIHVDNTLKGEPQSVIKLFRTGTSRYTQAPKEVPAEFQGKAPGRTAVQPSPFLLEGDPEYVVGERYVLFLDKGPELEKGLQAVIAPEGRYKIDSSDALVAVENRGLAKKLDGVTLSSFFTEYKGLKF